MGLRKHLIAGNWKMNGTLDSINEILKLDQLCNGYEVDIALCVPNTIISKTNEAISHKKLVIGAQNCHEEENYGAFTGSINSISLKVSVLNM